MKLHALTPFGLLLLAATAVADTAVYDLDAKNASEITDALQSVLSAQCTQSLGNPNACHAELLPTGQLLVAAPEAVQAQVAAVLKAIAARNVTPTPRVTLEYWVIYGEPRKPDASDAALKQLDSVLQQVERTHGELGFSVLDSTTLTTQSGTTANAHGGALQINQRVRANADSVSAAIQLTFSPAQALNVEVTIRRGEYVVLGERTAGEPDKSGRLFYVVHWPQGQ